MSLVTSLIVLLSISLMFHLLRVVVRRSLAETLKPLVSEILAVAEMCGCCLELGLVLEETGVAMWSLLLLAVLCYWSVAWTDDMSACPYLLFEMCWLGQISFYTAAMKLLAELAGAWLTWRYMQWVWWLELTPEHGRMRSQQNAGIWHSVGQERSNSDCVADLNVSVAAGATVEAAAVLACRIVERLLQDCRTRAAPLLSNAFTVLVVLAGLNYSGGYYNPILASAMKLGCSGHSALDHVVVYWCGATVGSMTSILLYPRISGRLHLRPATKLE